MVSWSDLANDVLEHLTSFLPLADQHRFSAVCHNWRLVAKQRHCSPAQELPWLVLGEDEKTKKRNFYNLSQQMHYSIDIPELYGQYICGSSFGWVFTVDEKLNGLLLNPFSRECYNLPPYPPYDVHGNDNAILTEEPVLGTEKIPFGYILRQKKGIETPGFTWKEMQMSLVRKAVLSHDPKERPDFTAMIVFGEFHTLAIWRPGEQVWTIINPDHSKDMVCFCDIICFKGKFYAACRWNKIYAVDVSSKPKITLITSIEPLIGQPLGIMWRYLVNFKGVLLVVFRFKKDSKPTKKFWVYEVDVKKRIWRKCRHLCQHALFVGNNSTWLADPRKVSGFINNGVYFNDVCESFYWTEFGHDYGVYDMVLKTKLQYCPDNDAFNPCEAALTWLTPNP